ncbi:hypothetical protein EV421DRAFT_1907158 [Armillaria borealis]|uniref:Heterokaryon incompatibility domain-containing protein n=1 Tax=Armillaria borealis TaxID=47425 RepID=A0AA39ML26_9AGAR|nr:hypothetical protein EV421DRAFT_1907158 [Armillaria borealis]
MDVWTPINGSEWPVPIPKDVSLDLVHIEMLNMGLEYVWLDVLCLRQKGGLREDLRVQEWKLDVPTIGYVYCFEDVYCYLSGLGRPFGVTQDYFDSDRCWFNCAWTLQEVGYWGVKICGATDGSLDVKLDKDGNYEDDIQARFDQKRQSLKQMVFRIFNVLEEMRCRVSMNPVDKIAGMAFLLVSYTIPAYYESWSLEDAWTALMETTNITMWGALFFLYPEPGNAGSKWRPSWDQVMKPGYYIPAEEYYYACVRRDMWTGVDECEAWCIEKGFVWGLAVEGTPGTSRHGELVIEDASGIQHAFDIIANHQYPIPEETYTLLGSNVSFYGPRRYGAQWVVGRRLSDESFEKLSVFKVEKDVAKAMMDDIGREMCINILV